MSSFIINENAFIEQAEYLNNFGMYVEHPMEKEIVKKLTSQGAKLIVGPRGVGKTTILLKAYQELISDESNVLPIYVNFKNSLKFEPLYKTKNNASLIFKQWLIASVLKELGKTLEELSSLKASYTILDKSYVLMKKLQSAEVALDESDVILMDEVVKLFEEVCVDLKKTRVIILMDDAAHAFSEEQQKDFFDFFREIKRTYISPKAAIYPGVTVFSSGFHVGHDAEELNLWLRVDDPSYLEFMQKILKVRLSESFFNYLFTETNLGPLLCYASFGIPRNLLNMTRDLLDGLSSTAAVGVKVADVFTVINSCHNANYNIYESLNAE